MPRSCEGTLCGLVLLFEIGVVLARLDGLAANEKTTRDEDCCRGAGGEARDARCAPHAHRSWPVGKERCAGSSSGDLELCYPLCGCWLMKRVVAIRTSLVSLL